MIFNQTFAFMKRLSLETVDPPRSYQAMHSVLISNIKLTKTQLTVNLLKKLLRLGIGTNEVEKYSSICGSQSVRRKYDRSLVLFAMKRKVQDASWAAEQARIKFLNKKTEYQKVVRKNTFIDLEFQQMMQYECNTIWQERKEKNRQKV